MHSSERQAQRGMQNGKEESKSKLKLSRFPMQAPRVRRI
jgi:hypothetical protein